MNARLETLIDRTFNHLQQLGSTIPGRRRPGLSAEYVETTFRELGLQVPDDLLALYTYCDGTSNYEGEKIRDIVFFPGFYWLPLGDALQVYHAVSIGEQWKNAWFPIFADGGGDFYAVICDNTLPYFGEVVGFVLGEPDQIVEFRDVTCMFETIERSFADGAFFRAEGSLDADSRKMRAIGRQVQPSFMEHDA